MIRVDGWFFEPLLKEKIPVSETFELTKFGCFDSYFFPTWTGYLESLSVAIKLMETPLAEGYRDGVFYIRAFQDLGSSERNRELLFGIGLPTDGRRRSIGVNMFTNLNNLGRGAPKRQAIVKSAWAKLQRIMIAPYEETKPTLGIYEIANSQDYFSVVDKFDDDFVIMYYDKKADRFSNICEWSRLCQVHLDLIEHAKRW